MSVPTAKDKSTAAAAYTAEQLELMRGLRMVQHLQQAADSLAQTSGENTVLPLRPHCLKSLIGRALVQVNNVQVHVGSSSLFMDCAGTQAKDDLPFEFRSPSRGKVNCFSASLADRGSAFCTVEQVAARRAAGANNNRVALLDELQRCLKEEVEAVVGLLDAARLGVALHETVLHGMKEANEQRKVQGIASHYKCCLWTPGIPTNIAVCEGE